MEAGLRASALMHFDDSDDDPGGVVFTGAYAQVLFGWSWLKLGPRVAAGRFAETSATELGVRVTPLVIRAELRY